jgi:hypothetical protein
MSFRGIDPPRARAIVHGSVQVHLWTGVTGNTVLLSGVMRELEVGAWLRPLLEDIHEVAVEHSMKEVVLDIRRLEYANAALWKCLVAWLKRIHQPGTKYNLRVISDPSQSWQRIGIPTLRVFGTDSQGVERLVVEELPA